MTIKTDGRTRIIRRGGVLLSGLLAGVLLGATPQIAAAGVASGATITWAGYAAYSTISTSPSYAIALTSTARTAGSAPAGWVGSQGRLLRSNGFIQCEGGWAYNGSTIAAGTYFGASSCGSTLAGLAWYSRGNGAGWNGSSYNTNGVPASPNQNS